LAGVARQEWEAEFKEQFCKELGWEVEENKSEERAVRLALGVKLTERQFDKELGGYQTVGYRKGKQEFFTCGSCGRGLLGAGHTGQAKNRNNPAFWGLEVSEKVLCLRCVKKGYYEVIKGEVRKKLNKYLGRGYK
jgi:hypothetical protein